jgi:pimeloyl-ACP methyl ester carboxylesterase
MAEVGPVEVVVVPGAGHLVPAEQPEALAEVLRRVLA